MSTGAIVFAGLMPHAPILVRGIGRHHRAQVRATIAAMAEVARHAVAARPDAVVVVSPHSPRSGDAFGLWYGARLTGTFEQFGYSGDKVDLPFDRALAESIEAEAARRGVRTWRIEEDTLDHGATVPLSFLRAAEWRGPTVIAGLPEPGSGHLDEFGRAIAAAACLVGRRVALIASGDMSHRLLPSAPLGYAEEGPRFDRLFVDLLRHGNPKAIQRIDAELLESAGEDVVEPTRVVLAASGFGTQHRSVLSYEGPFGVGYGVAILSEPDEAAGPATGALPRVLTTFAELPSLARASVTAYLQGGPEAAPCTAADELAENHGVFVTLRLSDGELRGCQGVTSAPAGNLVSLTWEVARGAAFRDTRFSPLGADELPFVHFSISILSALEPVVSLAELDPAHYGVLVATDDGRRGLLLPGIAGIDTIAEQLDIARQKGGIGHEVPVKIQRFTTRVIDE
ncbi:MAG TPA: class III extradiol ring-cleavage dioxygenase family protein [Opitutaceae bacterium]|nr:class III extradiol ring-cleavage dioxygenase family protein [Opitutaceae bacterium]